MNKIGLFLLMAVCFGVLGAGPELHAAEVKRSETELIKYLNTPWTGDLDDMRTRRYIRVLVTYSRTNFFLDGAQTKGLTADIVHSFEKWINLRLKTKKIPIYVAFIPVRRDELFTALRDGRGDIAASSLSITPERAKLVAFSEPWSTAVHEVVVGGPEAPMLNSVEDLSGQSVYVRRSSSYFETLDGLNARLATQGREPVRIEEVDENLESEDIMEMVGAGLIPLTVVDKYKADLWAKIIPGLQVRADLAVAQGQSIAWAVRKDSPQLLALINEFIPFFKTSKDYLYLGTKYFLRTGYLRDPTASKDMQRFSNAVRFFKKYGQQYDVDYLLMAAQGYQESRLDQNARSSRGAVGVMQLLPSTAAGAPVFLPNIKDLETNIHAGVKYHRHLINAYFQDPAISPLNRMLLAFAAYNAGPGNVSKMRRLTTDMGLDPNQWFANVEIAAGKVTGQETVRYVGNIFKYYVAYRMLQERALEREQTLQRWEEAE